MAFHKLYCLFDDCTFRELASGPHAKVNNSRFQEKALPNSQKRIFQCRRQNLIPKMHEKAVLIADFENRLHAYYENKFNIDDVLLFSSSIALKFSRRFALFITKR